MTERAFDQTARRKSRSERLHHGLAHALRLLVLKPRNEVALPLCAGGSVSASAGFTATASAVASCRLGRQRRASRSRLERLRVLVEGRVICGLGRAHNDA